MSKTAQETYKEKMQEAQAALAEITAYIEANSSVNANWGDVGDMGHINSLLREITNFINGTDE